MQKTKPPHRLHLSAPPLRKYIQRSAVLCTLWRALGAAACAFALSGASLLGRPLPLVLAFLASVPWGVLNLSAFFGAAVGTVLFWGVSKGLTVLAAAILLATESLIFLIFTGNWDRPQFGKSAFWSASPPAVFRHGWLQNIPPFNPVPGMA